MKFILISLLVVYLLSRVGGFLFRTLFWVLGTRAMQKQEQAQRTRPRRPEGDIRVDATPPPHGRRPPAAGDYIDVDYEEVK